MQLCHRQFQWQSRRYTRACHLRVSLFLRRYLISERHARGISFTYIRNEIYQTWKVETIIIKISNQITQKLWHRGIRNMPMFLSCLANIKDYVFQRMIKMCETTALSCRWRHDGYYKKRRNERKFNLRANSLGGRLHVVCSYGETDSAVNAFSKHYREEYTYRERFNIS